MGKSTISMAIFNSSLYVHQRVMIITLWLFNIAMENSHLEWIYPLNMVIFHGYVKWPDGNCG